MSTQDIQNFRLIRKNLERLKLLVEEAELWVQTKLTDMEEPAPRKAAKVSTTVLLEILVGNYTYLADFLSHCQY